MVPKPTDRLVLSTCEDSEDVASLNVHWEDEFGRPFHTDYICDRTLLHIFANKGTACMLT